MTGRRQVPKYVNVVSIGQVTRDEIYETMDVPQGRKSSITPQYTRIGGKAFNQSVAAARMGAKVSLVSAVGSDKAASEIRKALAREHVEKDFLLSYAVGRQEIPSVVVRLHEVPRGERKVVVVQDPSFLDYYENAITQAQDRILDADIIVVTFEFGPKVLMKLWPILQKLKERNRDALIVLNPAPEVSTARSIVRGLRISDIVVPNRWEARALVEDPDNLTTLEVAQDIYDTYGPRYVCITLGSEGACWYSASTSGSVPSQEVKVIDKVGASDVFVAVLAISFWHSRDFERSVQLANVAAAMAVERPGGADAAPGLKELLEMCRSLDRRKIRPSLTELATELAQLAMIE